MRDGNGVRRHREKKACGATLFQFRTFFHALTRHDNSAFLVFLLVLHARNKASGFGVRGKLGLMPVK
jgi:hypothetical protein